MDDLAELYQETILDHSRRPRNFGRLGQATGDAEGYNPLCGDRFHIWIDEAGESIREVKFEGSGCAISTASASIMTESVRGRTRAEAQHLIDLFLGLATGKRQPGAGELGKLSVFAGIRDYPTRVKCAVLAWHALKAALARGGTVSTE